MAYIISILILCAVLVGFLILVEYETRRDIRVCANMRARLDAHATRIAFIITHVDFNAFVRENMQRTAHRTAHSCAHTSLMAVRAAERALTRVVQRLRATRVAETPPRENVREFVRTLSDFKDHLHSPE